METILRVSTTLLLRRKVRDRLRHPLNFLSFLTPLDLIPVKLQSQFQSPYRKAPVNNLRQDRTVLRQLRQ